MELLNINERQYYRQRTLKVLEKWGIEGEINQHNIRNAASSYARIQIKNRIMKWVTIGAVLFLMVFLGMMIGSVVIGIDATKEIKVKNEMIVSESGNSPLKTKEVVYSSKLTLRTPLSFVQGIKSLKIETTAKNGFKEYIEFEVVSFYYSNGRNLTLYGHTQMAQVKPDGTIEIFPITTVNGAKRYDSSLVKRVGGGTGDSLNPPSTPEVVNEIYTCEQFRNIGTTGSYVLLADIDCGETYLPPIQSFGGRLNGNMHTVRINIDAQQGEGGVFSRLTSGAFISNIVFEGNVTGSSICGSISARSDPNVLFFTVNVYSSLVCNQLTPTSTVLVGGFVGALQNYVASKGVGFVRSVSQGKIEVVTSSPPNAYIGGFYGLANNPNYVVFRKSPVSATYFVNLEENLNNATVAPTADPSTQYNVALFGHKSANVVNLDSNSSKRNLVQKKVDINDDLNTVCEYTQEGMDWWNQWILSYDAVEHGYNTTFDNEIVENNTALCVYYFYNTGKLTEAACCANFGILYDCFTTRCPNTLAFGNPCMLCKSKYYNRDTTTNPTVYFDNGKPYTLFNYEEDNRYFYKNPQCSA